MSDEKEVALMLKENEVSTVLVSLRRFLEDEKKARKRGKSLSRYDDLEDVLDNIIKKVTEQRNKQL